MSQETRPLLIASKASQTTAFQTTYRATAVKPVTGTFDGIERNHANSANENDQFSHTIGPIGSFALIINNLTGPAMLGFPSLFQNAGIIPVTISIIFAWLASSLCGSMMADAIASINGNEDFSRHIDFSRAFRLIVGKDWYVVAETLFLMSCTVQACASLVEAAQSLDGFIASFLLGHTVGLQLYPSFEIISWDTSNCHEETEFLDESNNEDCTPFHSAGPLVLTCGFLLVTLLFLPLGLGHLKETITVQIFSMTCMFLLLLQFSCEFLRRGLDFPVPWVGRELSQLAGVVLFNYAFSITVPSWLSEKDKSVSVNRTIWSASSSVSLIYLVFGLMGAMAFEIAGPNVLILLASRKVHHLTRVCAALFGVTIIGCGVPVFCVIIKTGLLASGLCSPRWALFLGGCMPYLLSWMLYQGTILMSILNWAGLVVNGLVAFLLPMVLALKALELQARLPREAHITVPPQASVSSSLPTTPFVSLTSPMGTETELGQELDLALSVSHTTKRVASPGTMQGSASSKSRYSVEDGSQRYYPGGSELCLQVPGDRGFTELMASSLSLSPSGQTSASLRSSSTDGMDILLGTLKRLKVNTVVQPLPEALEGYRREIVVFMIASFTVIILTTIVEDAINGILLPEQN
jgi:amino acid permease